MSKLSFVKVPGTMEATVLRSEIDASINIIKQTPDGGSIESRYARRQEDTVIIYLSSMTGCDRACRMCHLTQMGETMMTPVTVDQYRRQAGDLFDILVKEGKLKGAKYVHFNFMARGDALSNPIFMAHTNHVIAALADKADWYSLIPKFKISTIFPTADYSSDYLKTWVHETLALHPNIEFYYSLYSLDRSFRKRWIPKARDPETIGAIFADTVGKLRLHHALIDGANTSVKNMASIGQWLSRYNIHCRFNLVPYNPFDASSDKAASPEVMEEWRVSMEKLEWIMSAKIKNRIGYDVSASCGMFVV